MNRKWPLLSYLTEKESYLTIHLFLQIAGKIKLRYTPWVNHSWHVTLFVTPCGFTTSTIAHPENAFQLDFNLIRHELVCFTESGNNFTIPLQSLSVASFYFELMSRLDDVGIKVEINRKPNEIMKPVPFDLDNIHIGYNPEVVERMHIAFLRSSEVLLKFRAKFSGKSSPVQFFWGGLDLALSRFSGKIAPLHPGGVPNLPDRVVQEAYSHEVCSFGFWPGNDVLPYAAFFSYLYPEPDGYKDYRISPPKAYYHEELREFILPYEAVCKSDDPEAILMEFLDSSYMAVVETGKWDAKSLDFNWK